MTFKDEDLVKHLCVTAAMMMEDMISIALLPLETTDDLLDALETLERHTQTIAKLINAALALAEN